MMKYLKLVVVPLCVLGFFLLVGLLWNLFDLPSKEELINIIKSYFDMYGILLVFVASIVESIFIIGIYAPGSTVIFLGVILSAGDPLKALLVVLSVIVGFLIGFTLDFYLGKLGWYKLFLHLGFDKVLEKTQTQIHKYGISVPWLGYHNPGVGSVVATTYGILNFSYLKFLKNSILPILAWCIFWGFLAYFLGMNALEVMGYKTVFIIFGIWIIARFVEVKIEERRNLLLK